MKKVSSYQKLKIENQNLKNDIYNLVRERQKESGIIAKMKWDLKYRIDDELYSGSQSSDRSLGIFK